MAAPRINLLHRLHDGNSWIQVTLEVAPEDFTRQHVQSLRTVVAKLTGTDAADVTVRGVCRWSPIVFFEMPAASADVLVGSFEREDARLSNSFETVSLPVSSIVFDLPGRPLATDSQRPWWLWALASFGDLFRPDRWLELFRWIGLVLAMVLTALPALALLALRWVWRKAGPRLKETAGAATEANLDYYTAALAIPAAFLILLFGNVIYVRGSVTYVLLLCTLVAYLNVSAEYHLLVSGVYTKNQVVHQTLLITFLPLVGALIVLYILGEDDFQRFAGSSPATSGHDKEHRSLVRSLLISPRFLHRCLRG